MKDPETLKEVQALMNDPEFKKEMDKITSGTTVYFYSEEEEKIILHYALLTLAMQIPCLPRPCSPLSR
jgi:hypothetical protein